VHTIGNSSLLCGTQRSANYEERPSEGKRVGERDQMLESGARGHRSDYEHKPVIVAGVVEPERPRSLADMNV
jgi:hypothetical protein